MEQSFDYSALDAPMPCDSPAEKGPTDTQVVRHGPCEVCGKRVFSEEDVEPPSLCPPCDDHTTATTVDLLVRGHRLPRQRG